jgi:hypothetical protein
VKIIKILFYNEKTRKYGTGHSSHYNSNVGKISRIVGVDNTQYPYELNCIGMACSEQELAKPTRKEINQYKRKELEEAI